MYNTQTGQYLGPQKGKKIYTFWEKLLLPIALIIGILFDRLIINQTQDLQKFYAAFWLSYIILFYIIYWKKAKINWFAWIITAGSVALCIWNLCFENNFPIRIINYIVIPSILMVHAQIIAGNLGARDVKKIIISWFSGWIINPFSGIPSFFGSIGSLSAKDKKSPIKKIIVALIISLGLLCIILPLLAGADKVFGYHLNNFFKDFNIGSLITHSFIVIITSVLFYSFLWNIGFGKNQITVSENKYNIDSIISCVITGVISLIYILFCTVQFTYLFAQKGLPEGMTYSEYAVSGFWQTVFVCGINIFIFSIFMHFNNKKIVQLFLSVLLILTGIMLVSGFVRLQLYIEQYGLTWLRVMSAWFVIFLVVTILICFLKMMLKKIPAVSICGLFLLGWYLALCFSNPDAFIERYNKKWHSENIKIEYQQIDNFNQIQMDFK